MIRRGDITEGSRRNDHEGNVWVHPFSGRLSSWFTWAFINLGLSANHVTFLSFLCGVVAALVLLTDSMVAAIAALMLFRLHVLLDVSDGEVARYRQQISRLGVYWDQSMHMIVYPLIFACLTWGRLISGTETVLVVFGMMGMLGKIIDLGVQNAYYRVLYTSASDDQPPATAVGPDRGAGGLRHLMNLVLHFAGYDGLLFFFAVAYLVDVTWLGFATRDFVIAAYSISLLLIAFTRMMLIPRRGGIPMRKDLR